MPESTQTPKRHDIRTILEPVVPPTPPADVIPQGHAAQVKWSKQHDPQWWDKDRPTA